MMRAGSFAGGRRGILTSQEVEQARHRIGARATAAMIARFLGRPVIDVQRILNPEADDVGRS